MSRPRIDWAAVGILVAFTICLVGLLLYGLSR